MSQQMQPQASQNWRSQLKWRSQVGVLIGLAAGVGIGHRLSLEAVDWVIVASFAAALFIYYRRIAVTSKGPDSAGRSPG